MPPASSPDPVALASWAEDHGVEPPALLAGLFVAGVAHRGVLVPPDAPLVASTLPVDVGDLPLGAEAITPDLLGLVLAAATAGARRRDGVVFTPRPTADGLVRAALAAGGVERPRAVVDPSVGGGAFALAAVRALVDGGTRPLDALARLRGVDSDPLSVAVTQAALGLWAAEVVGEVPSLPGVVVADFLLGGSAVLAELADGGPIDVVVGNPPFQSQLRRTTTRGKDHVDSLRRRFGDAAGPYTDTAALFLLASLDLVVDGGVVALVQPRSFLAADGAGEVRRRLVERAALVGLWEPKGRVFAAAVDVCAPIVVLGAAQPAEVQVWHQVDLADAAHERRATDLLGDDPALGLASSRDDQPPLVALPPRGGRLGDLATVTAGFRDQFYGMAPCVHEATGAADRRPRLVTSGLIDPGLHRWGSRAARYARQTWTAPVVEVGELDPDTRVGRWVRARLVPKLVVASQTKVIEAAIDVEGLVVPSPPTISVEGDPSDLPRLLAVLLAPATTAWLHRRAAGTGLAPEAVRVSVADLVDVPLPGDERAWQTATDLLLAICGGPDARPLGDDEPTRRFGHAMSVAYGLPPLTGEAVLAWWIDRLPSASIA